MKKLQIKPSVFQNAKDFYKVFGSLYSFTIAHGANWKTELNSAFLPKALQIPNKKISLHEVLSKILLIHIASSELPNTGYMTTRKQVAA